ncbi:MAG: cupin domain-containing protein [Fidelibacterota bacterium]
MKVQKKETAPRYVREDGITSYLLASPITTESRYLTTSLVVIQPGGYQRIHNHEPEQIYFILEGSGEMTVGDETLSVSPGDCIFIPSGALHGLNNVGESQLRYFSAASPSFTREELTSFWPSGSETESQPEAT